MTAVATVRSALHGLLDHPRLFAACRFSLVGRQTPSHRLVRRHLAGCQRVLDVCCGLAQFAADVDGAYVGIDLNPRFLRAASERWLGDVRKRFTVMDATALAFPDGAFDGVLCVAALHHFSDEAARRVLAEMRRVATQRVVIIDADGTRRGLVRRALLAADRGAWMRTPAALARVVRSVLPIQHTEVYTMGLYGAVLFECRVR